MTDLEASAIVEYIEATAVRVHFTDRGWPMIGIFRPAGPPDETATMIDPWQAREIGNLLQTIGERLNAAADRTEIERAKILQRPEYPNPT
jgi:hypothetical protein